MRGKCIVKLVFEVKKKENQIGIILQPSNNFGYDETKDILTIPHYAIFLLAKDLSEGTLKY